MDPKKHILSEVDKLFNRYGVKSVTMDDIARHLGMSKKTIYQYFENKNKLILTFMKEKIAAQVASINQGIEGVTNAVEELLFAVEKMEEILSQANPTLFFDLQKYYPEAWSLFRDFREHILYQKVLQNLQWGIAQKYYRSDINVEIIARLRVEQIDMAFNQQVFPVQKFSISQVIRALTEHFIYGISTESGRQILADFKQASQ